MALDQLLWAPIFLTSIIAAQFTMEVKCAACALDICLQTPLYPLTPFPLHWYAEYNSQTDEGAIVQGKSNEVVPKLKQDMKAILITNWKVWIPFQFFNFNFVPQKLQVCILKIQSWCSFAEHHCCGQQSKLFSDPVMMSSLCLAGAGLKRDGAGLEHLHVIHESQGSGANLRAV